MCVDVGVVLCGELCFWKGHQGRPPREGDIEGWLGWGRGEGTVRTEALRPISGL